MPPNIIFGAGGIGGSPTFTFTWTTPEATTEILSKLIGLGINELDSAAAYPPGNPWNTETLLGQAKVGDKPFLVDTKVLIDQAKGHTEEHVRWSVEKSLELLGVEKVRVLYLHLRDSVVSAKEQARTLDGLYKEGKFEKLGLSNFATEEMQEFLDVCEEGGFNKPSVYQGMYNALWRVDEDSLIPLLRKHGIVYNAYSPLAGGFLTGKVTDAQTAKTDETLNRTRWTGDSKMAFYPNTFDKPVIHDAIRKLQALCKEHQTTITEVSLRWLMHHSALGDADGIILGAKTFEQLEGNVKDCRGKALDGDLLAAVEQLWEQTKTKK